MTNQRMNRRQLLLSVAAMTALSPARLMAQDLPPIHVVKGQGCECCVAWVDYLRQEGFTVTDEVAYGTLLIRHKMDLGIPANAFSCHTGKIEGYALEGHVPAADIRRLLAEKPDAIGLSVPGMPYGSPGMGSEDNRDAYDVLLIQRDGKLPVFTSYPAA
ncbi:MAG: metal-binding protein [Rhodobacterales bacterium 32-67-9]|nr:MAG: metal-binding protein [Rhodobacterales bacterium 32-67-9]